MAWNDAVVTNAGVALLRQVLSGEKLTLDGAAGGTGTVSSASLMAQTALKDKKQTFSIVGMTNVDNGKKINLQVTNLDLVTGYALNQVGIWAHVGTGEPVLYAILQDPTGITIPSKTEMQDFAMNLYAVIDFGNDVSVNLTIDTTALVTRATLDKELNKKLDKGELGELAYKSTAEKDDLSDDVQASLEKADNAVQTETDPTVPSWAKQPTKPSYTADEIGAIPSAEKGMANGVASLDENGTVPDTQLPAVSITDTDVSVSPDVATALGLTGDPKVADALRKIHYKITYNLGFTVIDSNGEPVDGCTITVGTNEPVVSDLNGNAYMTVAAQNYNITCTSPIDYGISTKTVKVDCSDGKYHEVSFIIDKTSSDTQIAISNSISAAFSKNVTSFDIFVLGAGGSGGYRRSQSGSHAASSGGGAGGACTKLNLQNTSEHMKIVVGSGGIGIAGQDSSDGGDSSVISQKMNLNMVAGGGKRGRNGSVSGVEGGAGGTGDVTGANGGYGSSRDSEGFVQAGEDSNIYAFGETTNTKYGGGGGASATGYGGNGGQVGSHGGSPSGGAGATRAHDNVWGAKGGNGGIGAGGGACTYTNYSGSPGNGGDGLVIFRWRMLT